MKLEEIPEKSAALLKAVVVTLDAKKAEDLRILYVGEKSSITDFIVLATGNSDPHLRALTNSLHRELKDMKVTLVGSDAVPGSGWAVFDAFDVMVHVFTTEQRDFYRLDDLWKDARSVDPDALLKS